MSFLDGFVGGFGEQKGARETETRAEADRASAQEMQIFQSLLSSPDEETRNLALAGLMDSAKPRKKKGGLRGWMGELEQSPMLGQIRALAQTPVQTDPGTQAQPPSTQYPSLATPPPSLGQAPAGMAASSLTEPGAPAAPRPAPVQVPGKVGTPPTMGPRKMFATPEDTYAAQARGKARGDVEGDVAGLVATGVPEIAARETVRKAMERKSAGGMAGQTYAEGEIVADPDSPTGYSQTLYLRADPTVRQKIPAGAPSARSMRAPNTRELVAAEKYGKPGEDPRAVLPRLVPTELKAVLDEEIRRGGQMAAATTTARGEAAAKVPLTSSERAAEIGRIQDDWRTIDTPRRLLRRQFDTMKTAFSFAERNSGGIPAASEAIIVTWERMLDENSVVREAEARRPGSMQSWLSQIPAWRQQIQQGGARITMDKLRPYVALSEEIIKTAEGVMEEERGKIEGRARDAGIDPTLIFGRGSTPSSGGSPRIGTAPTGPTTPGTRQDANGRWMIDLP